MGAMPQEYADRLLAARDVSSRVADPELRNTLQDALDYLQKEITNQRNPAEADHSHRPSHKEPPAGTQSRLWAFFSVSDASFGVFYPRQHIMAVFPSFDLAKQAEITLQQAGFREDEVLAIRGQELLTFLDELRDYEGLWGALMSRLSRIFGTEEVFVDHDIRRARGGAGFLAVYCPDDAAADRIQAMLQPLGPLTMQRYLAGGIQSMI